MNMHKNARLTPRGRERIVRQVESGQTTEAVAEAAGVCPRTVRKWVDRYDATELFNIEVDELARILAFIAPDRFGRLQGIELIQPQSTQNTTDGG